MYDCVLECFVVVFVCVHSLRGLGTLGSKFYDCTAAGVVHSSYACMLVRVRTWGLGAYCDARQSTKGVCMLCMSMVVCVVKKRSGGLPNWDV